MHPTRQAVYRSRPVELIIDPAALRTARERRAFSQTALAKKAGVDRKTVFRLESKGGPVQGSTLDLLARALGVPRVALLQGGRATSALHALREPTPLEERAALEKKLRPKSTIDTPHGPLPLVGAKVLQDLLSGYAAYEGDRFVVRGDIEAYRALRPAEAAALGTRPGVGARFHVVRELAAGSPIGVTVWTRTAADTRRMHGLAADAEAKLVVRVVVAPEDEAPFAVFLREAPVPWSLVVEDVIL